MKNKPRIISLVIVIALVALVTSLGIAVLASGESAAPTVRIAYQNIAHTNNVSFKYAVIADDLPDGATVGVEVRKGDSKNVATCEATFEGMATIYGNRCYVFDFSGLYASEMAINVYATPYIELDGERIAVGEQKKSSILEYAYRILGRIDTGKTYSDDVKGLITSMLNYGAAVQDYTGNNADRMANDDYYYITLENGTFDDGFTKGLYKKGDKVTIVADDLNGYMFTSWKNSDGDEISSSSITDITVDTASAHYVAGYVKTNISYVLSGGGFDTEVGPGYTPGVEFELPVPTREGYVFSGWFTSSDFGIKNIISKIPASATGEYTLYAKWNKIISDLDGDEIYTKHGWIGNSDKETGEYKNERESDGKTIVWTQGDSQASQVGMSGNIYGNLEGATSVTFSVTMAKEAGYNVTPGQFRIRRSNGTDESGNRSFMAFKLDASGNVILGGAEGYIVATLTEEMQTINVVVDFAAKTITSYNGRGIPTATYYFQLPSLDAGMDYLDWLEMLKGVLWQFYSDKQEGSGKLIIGNISVYAGNAAERGEKNVMSDEEYAEKVAEMQALLATQRDKITAGNLFGSPTANIGTSKWGTAPYDPIDEHPRLLVNGDTIDLVREQLEKMDDNTKMNFINTAGRVLLDNAILPEPENKGTNATVDADNIHNYNDTYLGVIQAKALYYLLYGEEIYGYQAIYYMKNYIDSLDIVQIASDQCRQYGYVMFTAALVYDWCYDLLTEADKTQLIAGVENRLCRGENQIGAKMEVGFPPAGQSSVNGHGSEYQILRDYLAFATAIYDENETWWDYIAARVCNDFVSMRNYYFQSGIVHQGTGYATTRHISDFYSAWILEVATGTNPYVGMENTVRSLIGYEFKAGSIFNDGDNTGDSKATSTLLNLAYISAYLYGDEAMLAQAKYMRGSGVFGTAYSSLTPATYVALLGLADIEPAADRYEGMDLIQYNGYPLGQYIIRQSWTDANSAAVFMRIKEMNTSNHEHRDSGTFEIYYKGMLTSDGGGYNNFGHEHTQHFHQATISHNGLIIYDESKWNYSSAKAETKWYSGGQRIVGSAGSTLESWKGNANMVTGAVTGLQHGYSDAAEKNPLYAYIAGDITKAYDSKQATYVGRRMLTVYTGNADFPMVFFVYDDIDSYSGVSQMLGGAHFEKRFLLQISSDDEPTVSGNTVITENDGGRLVLTSLSDSVTINKVGGRNAKYGEGFSAKDSSNYLINGNQLCPKSNTVDDGHWGRVEIVWSENSKNAKFMNVLYVTDAGQTKTAPAITEISGTGVEGGAFGDVVAIFATSRNESDTTISATVSGSGTMKYYVSGVAAGNWSISVNGTSYGIATATEEGGLLTFEAPAGELLLTPAPGQIVYELGELSLPENAPTTYKRGTSVALPTPICASGVLFGGWYTDPDFSASSKVSAVPVDAGYEFKVYAKYSTPFLHEDYSNTTITKASTVNGIKYAYSSTIKTETENGNKYLYMSTSNSEGAQITSSGNLKDKLGDTKKLTFLVDLSRDAEDELLPIDFRVRANTGNVNVGFFYILSNGDIRLGKDTNMIIGSLSSSEFTTFIVTLDFTDSTGTNIGLTAYGLDGSVLAETTVSKHANYATVGDFYDTMTTYIFDGQSYKGNGTLKVGRISLYVGDVFN